MYGIKRENKTGRKWYVNYLRSPILIDGSNFLQAMGPETPMGAHAKSESKEATGGAQQKYTSDENCLIDLVGTERCGVGFPATLDSIHRKVGEKGSTSTSCASASPSTSARPGVR